MRFLVDFAESQLIKLITLSSRAKETPPNKAKLLTNTSSTSLCSEKKREKVSGRQKGWVLKVFFNTQYFSKTYFQVTVVRKKSSYRSYFRSEKKGQKQ